MCSSLTPEARFRTPCLPVELVIAIIQYLSGLDNSLSSLRSCSLVSRDWNTITSPILYARPFLFDGKGDEDSDAQFKTFKLSRLKFLVRTLLCSLTFKERMALWGAGGADAALFTTTKAKESTFPVSRSTNRRLTKEAAGAYEEAMRKLTEWTTGPSQQEEEDFKPKAAASSVDYFTYLASFDFAKFFYGLQLLNLLPKSNQTLTTLYTFVFVHAKRLDTLSFGRAPGSRPFTSPNSPYYSQAQIDPPTPIPVNLSNLAKARGRNIRRIQLTHADAAETLRQLTPHCCCLKYIVIDVHDVQSRFSRDATDRDTMELDIALSKLIGAQVSATNQTAVRGLLAENAGIRVPESDVFENAKRPSNINHPPKLEMLMLNNGALLWDHVEFLFSLVKTGLASMLLDLRLDSMQMSVSRIYLLSHFTSLRRVHLEGKMRWPGSSDEAAFDAAPHEEIALLNEQLIKWELPHFADPSSLALSQPAPFMPSMGTFFAALANTVTHFSVESFPDFILNQMANHWCNLRTLCLRRGTYTLQTWQSLTIGCPQIRVLELVNCHGLDEHAVRCLTGTSSSSTSAIGSDSDTHSTARLPIESLSLQLLGLPDPVISVIPYFDNLRTLTLSGIHSMTDKGFKHGLVAGIATRCDRFEALLLKDIWASGLAEDGGGGIGTEYGVPGGGGGQNSGKRNTSETGWILDEQIEWARAAGVNAMRTAATRRHG